MDMVNVQENLQQAKDFVLDGTRQILTGTVDERHGVSVSPGATALACLALLAVGRGFEAPMQRGTQWLWKNRQFQGWGKYPGDQPDQEVIRIVTTVLQGTQGSWIAKVRLLAEARQFSQLILSLGQGVVPGLEGPAPEEIQLPGILHDDVQAKLPVYGRPVVVAAALLASKDNQTGLAEAIRYLRDTQIKDGSWSEDIVATSMGMLALLRYRGNDNQTKQAAHWLVRKQYPGGGWPAFDQLFTWAMGWAVSIMAETPARLRNREENKWLGQAVEWLRQGQNTDGSYGSTPPYAHPDLDDTAVALIGLHQVTGGQNPASVQLLKRLQNPDGSWGTFPSFTGIPPGIECGFPVYINSVDVTIHVLEALWRQNSRTQERAIWNGLNWILQQQDGNGAFPSVWFAGSFYSTAQVLELLGKWRFSWEQWKSARRIFAARKKCLDFLLNHQNANGGWGTTVIESALTLAALGPFSRGDPIDRFSPGIKYLIDHQKKDGSFEPAYRGIYAKGWNYEEPIATALTAIRAFQRYRLFGDKH